METQNNINLLNDSRIQICYKKWYVIDSLTAKDKYNQSNSIKFETEGIRWSLCDYSDAFILITGDITVSAGNNTDVAFKNCAPVSTCKTEINDVFIDEANHAYVQIDWIQW